MEKRIWISMMLLIMGTAAHAQTKMTAEQYIATYKDKAVEEMKRTGIPASITLAQGLIESGNGNSYLAREANNHFGIKCKKDWTGKSVSLTDDAPDECFRAYNTAEESYRDHSDFLVNNPRYAFLFDLEPTDYKGWANGLKQAGYATNPRYPQMIIDVVERYGLDQYDKGNKHVPRQEHIATDTKEHLNKDESGFSYNGIPAYIVKKGETYDDITKKFSLWHFQLRKYNNLPRDISLPEGTVLYLKPKKRKGDEEFHTVQPGENMAYISQITGVKLNRLYKLNRMEEKQEPAAGEKIALRSRRDTPPKLDQKNILLAWQPVVIKPKTREKPPQDKTQQKTADNKVKAPKDTAFHVVKAGETLPNIANTYQVSMEELLEWNNIPDSSVRLGQLLRVKAPAGQIMPKKVEDSVTTQTADGVPTEMIVKDSALFQPNKKPEKQQTQNKTVVANSNTVSTPTINKQLTTSSSESTYTVQPGETLYAISRKTGISVEQIKQLNGLTDNAISVGQQLKIKPEEVKQQNITKTTHTVQTGDTLYSISKKYGVSVEQIKTWNGMDSVNLQIGQQLIIGN
jgi:LysM repeat protein